MTASRTTFGAVLVLCSFTVASHANARSTAVGGGVHTCAQFLQDYRKDPTGFDDLYFQWAQGVLTGMNSDLSDSDKVQRLSRVLVRRCSRHSFDYTVINTRHSSIFKRSTLCLLVCGRSDELQCRAGDDLEVNLTSAIAENSATPVMRSCSIPSLSAPAVPVVLAVETGKSIIIVGANGSGKTRLGAYL